MKKDPILFLEHIIESLDLIESYLENQSEKSFKKSQQLQDSCIRRLEIIGEAVKNLPAGLKLSYPHIPRKKIAGMRDILIHEYFGVDIELTWRVLTKELAAIKHHVLELKKQLQS